MKIKSPNFYYKNKLVLILILASLIRLAYFFAILIKNPSGFYVYDSNGYWNIAYNLKTYGVFSQSIDVPLNPDYYRTPLYPFFILLAESIQVETIPIIILQIILGVATCYITYKIANQIFENNLISSLAALIIAIDVPNIVMNNLVMTETLFTFLLTISVYYFIRYLKYPGIKSLVLNGILCGLLILCRPISFFIPYLWALFIIYKLWPHKIKMIVSLILFSAITLITISPWLIRNKITFNHYFMSVIREHDMQNYQAATIYSELNNISFPEAQNKLRWKTYYEFGKTAHNKPYEYARHIEKDAFNIMFSNPDILLKHHAIQFFHFFIKPCRSYIDVQLGHWGNGYDMIPKNVSMFDYIFTHNSRLTITAVFFQLAVLLICYILFIPAFLFFKKEKQLLYFLLLAGLIFCFANLTLPNVTESRYRVPVMSYIAIIAGSGIYYIKAKRNKQINLTNEKTNKPLL